MRKFTAAEVQAIIEAERRGEFQLPEGDYTDATLTAALERIDTAAAYRITARRAIAEMEQPAPAKHGYGCACADCGREREDRKASDRQDCETSEMTEEAKAANRAMIAEMDSETLEALTEKMAVVLMEPDEDQRSEFQRRADLANVHSFTERNA
jgi:predicted metal-dependent phosphoesterase TrpH